MSNFMLNSKRGTDHNFKQNVMIGQAAASTSLKLIAPRNLDEYSYAEIGAWLGQMSYETIMDLKSFVENCK